MAKRDRECWGWVSGYNLKWGSLGQPHHQMTLEHKPEGGEAFPLSLGLTMLFLPPGLVPCISSAWNAVLQGLCWPTALPPLLEFLFK